MNSNHFKNLKKSLGFMKEFFKNWWFFGWLFDFFNKNEINGTYCLEPWLLALIITLIIAQHWY
jgi:hypothetical protein